MNRWLLVPTFLLVACDEPFRPYQPTAAVRVTPDSATMLWGARLQLRATGTDSVGNPLPGRPITWASANPAVANVSRNGEVAALAGGFAIITATSGQATGAAAIRVHVPVASVTFGYPSQTVLLGATLPLVATPRDSLGRPLLGRAIAWVSSDTTLVTVSAAGVAAGHAPGTATITATSEGRAGDATVRVDVVTFVAIVAAESDHTCALTDQGRAFCWGSDILGQLGNGPATGSATPVEVAGGTGFASLTGGGWFTCGVTSAGVAHCWGSGARGRLGGGSLESRPAPHLVAGGLVFLSVRAGWAHACGITDDGTYCWGSGVALGSDAGKYALSPMPVPGDIGFLTLDTGGDFSCALTGAGAAWCWGVNFAGQLGDGSTTTTTPPVPVSGGLGFTALSVGSRHACGLTSAGAAWCWGDNSAGELGDGSRLSARGPEPVAGGIAFTGLSAGGDFTCGWTADGTAYCWGANALGQLGAASAEICGPQSCSTTPLPMSGGLRFRTVGVGGTHACGIALDGVAYCWGANQSGQLGDGTTDARPDPVRVIGQR
ncbi:MAG: Ig-like domain-containing protein [Gemmatimonadetes bacterium]|nr:Ig-like domain-containing protein [Gemmatimonadota bacterium]